MLDQDVVNEIKQLSRETQVKGDNPAHTIWKLNDFAKTPEGLPFKKRIYSAKTNFTISALRNTGNKLGKKFKFKFVRGQGTRPMSMHPKSGKKAIEDAGLVDYSK